MSERSRYIFWWGLLGLNSLWMVAHVKGWVPRPSEVVDTFIATWASGFFARWAFEIVRQRGRVMRLAGVLGFTLSAAFGYWALAFLGAVPRWWPIFQWQVK